MGTRISNPIRHRDRIESVYLERYDFFERYFFQTLSIFKERTCSSEKRHGNLPHTILLKSEKLSIFGIIQNGQTQFFQIFSEVLPEW